MTIGVSTSPQHVRHSGEDQMRREMRTNDAIGISLGRRQQQEAVALGHRWESYDDEGVSN